MKRIDLDTFNKISAKLDRASASLFVLSECVEWQNGGHVGGAVLANAVRTVLDQLEEVKTLMRQPNNAPKGGYDEERA